MIPADNEHVLDQASGNGNKESRQIVELVKLLRTPGTVIAIDEEVKSTALPYEQLIPPGESGIPFAMHLTPAEAICVMEAKRTDISVKSGACQGGANIQKMVYDNGLFTGNMKNKGPRTIRIPAGYEMPIGFPYFMSPHANDNIVASRIAIYQELNPRTSIERVQQRDVSSGINLTLMFVEMETRLRYEPMVPQNGKGDGVISLDEIPRGTEREQLYVFLHVTRVDDPSHPAVVQKDENIMYTLMETKEPIHYPEGGGIVILGGAVIKKNGSVIPLYHGDSVVGQHRKHGNGSSDPAHTLVGEFLLPNWAIDDVKRNGDRIGIVCEPVALHWATPGGHLLNGK